MGQNTYRFFHFKADECVIEEDTKYDVDRGATNLNPDKEGRTYFETYEECKTFCEEEYPGQAKFFTWNEGESGRQKNRLACRCKADATGKRRKKGMISGNLFCGTPAPPPPAREYQHYELMTMFEESSSICLNSHV